MMNPYLLILFLLCVLTGPGCDSTDPMAALDAGLDAVKAVTLSDKDVKALALKASGQSDAEHQIAGPSSGYGKRLTRLAGDRYASDGYDFNFKVYLSDTVNAFAMADGTIRIYSGLMDMMNDQELVFVIGHEMGHVVKKHIKKKIRLAYAGSAVRKGIASQQGIAGQIARSGFGAFLEILVNAQFSQQEEREADDYGLAYLKKKGLETKNAVSALEKLAALGSGHSFLSSHPEPQARAERIQDQIDHPEMNAQPSFLEIILNNLNKLYLSLIEKLT